MKKTMWLLILAGILMAAIAYFYPNAKKETFTIGLVLPLHHAALDDIADGFKSELQKEMGSLGVNIEVQNALGDINLQKSAINKFINSRVNLLVPVTTSTTQMAINLAPNTVNVLFLAANIPPDSAAAQARPGLMGIIDEIPVNTQLQFIRGVMPELKKLAIVYSSSDKDFEDARKFQAVAQGAGIEVQMLMVQNVSELYTVSQRIENDCGAIFVLKDNVVASGIATLVKQANARKIPLITSDEGTNKSGSAFAVGVIEKDIGRQGARMAARFLKDGKPDKEAIEYLSRILVFVNNAACAQQGVDVESILRTASMMKLEVMKE